MKKPSKLKLKNKDVDDTADQTLADDKQVSVQVSSTASEEITVDEDSLENASLRSTEKTQIVGVKAASPNKDRKFLDLKLSSGKSKQSDKDVQKYRTSEIVDTDEYLIITLSASRRIEMPKTKKPSILKVVSESSGINTQASKVKSSGVESYKRITMPKCTSSCDSKTSQISNMEIQASSELKSSKTSKYSKVLDESSDCKSTDTSISIKSSEVCSDTTEAYKAKTCFVLHDASEATTKHPDAEFYDEIRNHTTPSLWNNPVLYNRYPIYFDPYRHFPYEYRPPKTNFRARTSAKIPKKFSTFLLRVLKSKTVHRETDNMNLKKESISVKAQELRDPNTDELGNPISTYNRATNTSPAKIENNLIEQSPVIVNVTKPFKQLSTITSSEDPIVSKNTISTIGLTKPSTSKYRHRYSTSVSATDSLSTSTKIRKHLDPIAPGAVINPVPAHSKTTEAAPFDPLSMNPIKFREKLRKLSHSESSVESPGAQRKATSSKHKTRAIPKIRAEPTKDKNSGAIYNAELAKNEEKFLRTVPEIGSLQKGDSQCEKAMPEQGKLYKHTHGAKDVPKSGGVSKVGIGSKIEAIPTEGTTLKVKSLEKGGTVLKLGAVPTKGKLPKDASVPKGGFVSNIKGIPTEKEVPRHKKATSKLKCDIPAKTEAIPKTEKISTRTVTVIPQDESQSKNSSKTQSGTNLRKGEYRDVPVIAYVRKLKSNPAKKNLDYYLPKQDGGWNRSYWRKFKYFKRIESERQQSLLEKIVSSLNQIDLSLQSAYNYSYSINKIRQVTSDMKDFLKNRNEKMKWLTSRLMNKTEMISDLLETIRCDVVLYTLETSASNDITSKRLYKLLKYLCGKQERKRKSEGKLTPVEEEI